MPLSHLLHVALAGGTDGSRTAQSAAVKGEVRVFPTIWMSGRLAFSMAMEASRTE